VEITVKEMPVVLQILQYGLHLLLKRNNRYFWKAFEGILNDRAENPAQHSKLLKFLWCWRRNMFLYTI
jgi:hypothetical protein